MVMMFSMCFCDFLVSCIHSQLMDGLLRFSYIWFKEICDFLNASFLFFDENNSAHLALQLGTVEAIEFATCGNSKSCYLGDYLCSNDFFGLEYFSARRRWADNARFARGDVQNGVRQMTAAGTFQI